MKQAICLYLHVHQPLRIKHYTVFDCSNDHEYFNDSTPNALTNNKFIIDKVSGKSYAPTNALLLKLLEKYPDFKLSISMSGTAIEQFENFAPEVLNSFKALFSTGRVEIVAETYHHSLAFFYSRDEFENQVKLHEQKVMDVFGVKPRVFRNTELSYNNDLAYWADKAGYKGILCEGWDPILGWRNSNHVYRPSYTTNIKLLMKNYRISDDLAFRFWDQGWCEWPLTADKYVHWLESTANSEIFNIFMDYETFGEHQWENTGIFEFMEHLPDKWIKRDSGSERTFMTLSEAIDTFNPVDEIDVPYTLTWADTERDLSAWMGNNMQQQALQAIYMIEKDVLSTGDNKLIDDWRKLQTSDHFYYMCTKWFNDGDIHAYFNPYETPYEAFINFMNAFQDVKFRLSEHGVKV